MRDRRTLYKASSISLNVSGVKFPGSIPFTSLPKFANFDASALAGSGRGANSTEAIDAYPRFEFK